MNQSEPRSAGSLSQQGSPWYIRLQNQFWVTMVTKGASRKKLFIQDIKWHILGVEDKRGEGRKCNVCGSKFKRYSAACFTLFLFLLSKITEPRGALNSPHSSGGPLAPDAPVSASPVTVDFRASQTRCLNGWAHWTLWVPVAQISITVPSPQESVLCKPLPQFWIVWLQRKIQNSTPGYVPTLRPLPINVAYQFHIPHTNDRRRWNRSRWWLVYTCSLALLATCPSNKSSPVEKSALVTAAFSLAALRDKLSSPQPAGALWFGLHSTTHYSCLLTRGVACLKTKKRECVTLQMNKLRPSQQPCR